MINKELIERLQKFPEDFEVFIDKDCCIISKSESNLERVTDIYPNSEGNQILLIGEG